MIDIHPNSFCEATGRKDEEYVEQQRRFHCEKSEIIFNCRSPKKVNPSNWNAPCMIGGFKKKVEMSGDTLRQKIGWNKTWIALLRTWQQKFERQVVVSCSRIDNCHYHFHCKHVNNRPRDRLTIGFVIVIALIIIIDQYHYHYHCNCHNEHGTKEWEAVRGFLQQDSQFSAQLSGDES